MKKEKPYNMYFEQQRGSELLKNFEVHEIGGRKMLYLHLHKHLIDYLA